MLRTLSVWHRRVRILTIYLNYDTQGCIKGILDEKHTGRPSVKIVESLWGSVGLLPQTLTSTVGVVAILLPASSREQKGTLGSGQLGGQQSGLQF